MRVVLDTAVVVAAARSDRGASFQWLLAAFERRVTSLLPVPLCLEHEAVLKRPEQLRAAGATAAEADRLLDAPVAAAERVEISLLWRPGLRDAADEMVLETAVNGGADWLLTFDVADLAAAARFGVDGGKPGAVLRAAGMIRDGEAG